LQGIRPFKPRIFVPTLQSFQLTYLIKTRQKKLFRSSEFFGPPDATNTYFPSTTNPPKKHIGEHKKGEFEHGKKGRKGKELVDRGIIGGGVKNVQYRLKYHLFSIPALQNGFKTVKSRLKLIYNQLMERFKSNGGYYRSCGSDLGVLDEKLDQNVVFSRKLTFLKFQKNAKKLHLILKTAICTCLFSPNRFSDGSNNSEESFDHFYTLFQSYFSQLIPTSHPSHPVNNTTKAQNVNQLNAFSDVDQNIDLLVKLYRINMAGIIKKAHNTNVLRQNLTIKSILKTSKPDTDLNRKEKHVSFDLDPVSDDGNPSIWQQWRDYGSKLGQSSRKKTRKSC